MPFLTPNCIELRRSVINTGPKRNAVPKPRNKPCNKLNSAIPVKCWLETFDQRKTYQMELWKQSV